ncbi:MAG: hypothetical protein QM784_33550 [Polyangiaceae bacterium]
MNPSAFPIRWIPREEPLSPTAARVPNDEVGLLVDGPSLDGLNALTTKDALILLGQEDCLPWTPNVRYFGRDPSAPSLYVPTDRMPNVPYELFEQCLRRRFTFKGPLLVDAVGRRVLGMHTERPLKRSLLLEYGNGHGPCN